MNETRGVEEDLQYVRSVVNAAEGRSSPGTVYYLWAAILFVGYALLDFRPQVASVYWWIAGPVGGLSSLVLGMRGARRSGQESRSEGIRYGLHWSGVMGAIAMVIFLAAAWRLPPSVVPALVLLVVGLGYFTAGVHVERRLLPLGLVMAACFVAAVLLRDWQYVWTLTGVVLGASLATCGYLAGRAARPLGLERPGP